MKIEYLICPTCAATIGRGDHFTEGLDTREMFIKNGMAVLLCPICGREFVLEKHLKCSHEGCNNSVTHLIVSKHSNDQTPVAAFCEAHKPRGFISYLRYYLFGGGQDAVPYIADEIKGRCIKCGNDITCSNKTISTRCSTCGKEYVRKIQLLGSDTLEP